jgi:hypothetical protein
MKTLLLLFLPVLASWCNPPKGINPEHAPAEKNTIDTIAKPAQQADNIRFLQRVNNELIYANVWSGPVIAATFHDYKTGELLKTVNIRDRNPYLNIRYSIKHYDGEDMNDAIYLHTDKAKGKAEIKAYLPQYLYNEIPNEWFFSDAITMCMPSRNWAKAERYIPVYYLLEWAPHPEKQFMGNYGVTMVTVLDSTGTEVYRQQFDGLLSDAAVSEDGNYLAIAYTLYPENGQETPSRLMNCAELMFMPLNKSVWRDTTYIINEEFFFTCHTEYLEIKKIKHSADEYYLWILDTKTGKLYYRAMYEESWKGGITSITDGQIIRQVPNKQNAIMDIGTYFKTQTLLNQ